jgi:hypothetical protein
VHSVNAKEAALHAGLANRRHFDQFPDVEFKRAKRLVSPLSQPQLIGEQLEHELAQPTIGRILVVSGMPEQIDLDFRQFQRRR